MVRSSYGISTFSLPVHWAKQRFYSIRFFGTVDEVFADI